ncbi:MAG: DNA methyltransferase [Limimaricola soesokkakensis]|uniref:DNA methyltransferase n=1 Tax=Limimaricola soesokkakensis TaxID=1343159 RepID=UPI0040599218
MTTIEQAEVRFVELMAELFQLDEAERLDFGFYRVIRHHNQEVRAFLGQVVEKNGSKALEGGKLSEILAAAFRKADDEESAGDRLRLKEIEGEFGIKPGMNDQERRDLLDQAERFPGFKSKVDEYRSLQEQLRSSENVGSDRREVLNRLYQFFSRHYQDGDFIVERRYGRDGSRYIRSTGEDTEFHWATEDMYYIKSGDTFTDFTVRLSNGERIVFSVEPEELQSTRASLKPTDKAHYEIDVVTKADDGQHIVLLKYLKGAQSNKQKDDIVRAIQEHINADEAELKRWLNHFVARNQSDFFIHKRLGAALREDLDIFLKTEVLNADQLLVDTNLPRRLIKVSRIVRDIGRQIIDFLAVLEEFQKSLWEKKKLVFNTRYVISLDRIAKLAGEDWLVAHLPEIIAAQRAEWKELGLGDFSAVDDCRETIKGDLAQATRKRWFPLPVDTKHFDPAFRWDLVAAITELNQLEAVIDGVALRSDNWQALNSIKPKFAESVKCVYIDPPYNTATSSIPYKNGYKKASWAALMRDRTEAIRDLMNRESAIFVSIDSEERTNLEHVLSEVFGSQNRVEELIWTQNTANSQLSLYSTNHEFVHVFAKARPVTESIPQMYREPKPGCAEILDLVERLGHDYPEINEVEKAIAALFEQHQIEYREQLEERGLEWNKETKKQDPWKGIMPYKYAEYRDKEGKYVPEEDAREREAVLWVWSEIPTAAPASKQAETTKDPKHVNFRYYKPLHPVTKKACGHPNSGWKFPEFPDPESPGRRSFQSLSEDHRIAWGPNEKKVPRTKGFLHEVETNIGTSVFYDYNDGEAQLTDLFGTAGAFLSPKNSRFVRRFINQAAEKDSTILDCFGGSGSSAHAVIEANRLDFGHRKFITVEVNRYFETLVVPRIKKVGTAAQWKSGSAKDLRGPGVFVRVQELEQYDDTLESLNIDQRTVQDAMAFENLAFSIQYRLDREARKLFQSVDHFRSPFGYSIKCAHGGGEAVDREVDLVESLIYLLGLDVARLYREDHGAVITGTDRRNRCVTVLFRECDREGNEAWCKAKMVEHPANRFLTNAMPELAFEGCERFEAIEAIFATQFGDR